MLARPLAWTMFLTLLGTASLCRAQVVAPPVERRGAELGFAYKWFDRDVTSAQATKAQWDVGAFYARYGGWSWLTLCVEGGLWDIASDDDPRTFRRWTVGGALSARLFQRDAWFLFANGTYNEVYDLDETALRSDEHTRSFTLGVLATRRLEHGGQRLDVFAGPMFVYDRVEAYPFNADDPVELETDPVLGVAAGVSGHVFHYIGGFAYLLYAEHAQVRLGVSVRTRGGRP